MGAEVMNWDSTAADPATALALGVDGSTDTLSLRFAQVGVGGSADILTLRIADVGNLADYARVLAYLRSLNGVADVQVERVGASELTCRLSVEVAASAVVRTISLGNTLAVVNVAPVAGATAGQPPAELNYRLLP